MFVISAEIGKQHHNSHTFTHPFHSRETRAQLLGKGERKIGGSTAYELNSTEIRSCKLGMMHDLVDEGRD